MEVNKSNKVLEHKWLFRFGAFFIFLIPLLLIKNEFHMFDEYYYAINFDQGVGVVHAYQILNNIVRYAIWFLSTSLGFTISAFRALQITSSVFAAIGAVALVDLAIFWGLRVQYAVLFSLPTILSNAFVRYGTSAYPDAAAMGIGLLAVNLVVRSVAKQCETSKNAISILPLYVSGVAAGIAGLFHVVFLSLFPGLLLGILLILRKFKQTVARIFISIGAYSFGMFTVIGIGYGFVKILSKSSPEQVSVNSLYHTNTIVALLRGKTPDWLPGIPDLITNIKTFGVALFIPGVHVSNSLLDLLFNIPRVTAVVVLCWLFYKTWKKREQNISISYWIIPMMLSVLSLFLLQLFTDFTQCRQYALISLAVVGPLFLATGITALKKGSSYFKLPILIITAVFMFHMIFGVEGLVEITTHNSRGMRKIYEYCDVHRPKKVQFPWNVDTRSLDKRCPSRVVETQ